MPANYTATGLLAAVRRNAALGPSNGDSFPTDTDLLAWLNEEMSNYLVPMLMRPREERFVEYFDFETEANEDSYAIPTASLWEDLRDVQIRPPSASQYVSINRVEPELAPLAGAPNTASTPTLYYLRANDVVLVPTPGAGVAVRVKYFRRPGNIVSSGYSLVSNVSGSDPYTVTVASTTGMSSGQFDLVSSVVPFGVLVWDVEGTVEDGTTVELDATAAQATVIEAYEGAAYLIAHADAPGPQISQDLVSLLTQRTTYRALLAKKDRDGAKDQFAECARTEAKIVASMNQRADGLGRHVVDRKFVGSGWGITGWRGGVR